MAYHHSQDSHHDIEVNATTPLLLPTTPTTPTNDTKTYDNHINKPLTTPITGTSCGHTCCHAHTRNIERDLVRPSYYYTQYHNPTDWLVMFEEVARANNWSPRAKLDIIPIFLQEGYQPRTWFRQNRYQWESVASGEGAEAEEREFEVFREAFLKQFGDRKDYVVRCSSMGKLVFLVVVSLVVLLIFM